MAISNDEAAKLVDHIEIAVRKAAAEQDKPGILDIINQWRSDIEAGRQIERKLTVRQSPGLDVLSDTPQSRRSSSGDFVGKEDYTPIEQLEMLIAALGIAFIAPEMMAQRFMDTIAEFGGTDTTVPHDPSIRLVGFGEADEPGPDHMARISRGSIRQSREQTSKLAALLLEISEAAGLSGRKLTDRVEFG
jgi:hypothetical protein